jgi:ribosomal protein L32
MDIGAIFFILAVVTLVGMYVGQPYIRSRGRRATQEDREYSALMAEYDRAVNTLQELDFDNALGKVPAEDYPTQRAELLAKGADLLRKLDSFVPSPAPNGRSKGTKNEVKSRRKARKEKSAGFCPKCGKSILVSDRFCPSCGKAIN